MKRTRSIGFRLTAGYAVMLSAGLGLFGALIWLSMQHRMMGEVDEDLEDQSSRLQSYVKAESEDGVGGHLKVELREFAQALPAGNSIDLSGPDGFVFHYVSPPEPVRDFRTRREHFIVNGRAFDLELRTSVHAVLHTLRLLRLLLWSLFPLMIVIACAGGAWLSRRALRPVKDITDAARVLSVENLSARLPVPPTEDELARLTEVLNFTLERLEDAMKTLSQFVADASHEIRTPLAVIRTTAELALRRDRTPESYRDSLQDVASEAARMTQLVEDLLTLARGDAGAWEISREPVDLRSVMEDVSSEMRRIAELRDISIENPAGIHSAMVWASKPALHRLLLVLIDNAVKYSPRGSRVIAGVQAGQEHVTVTIRDFGDGISAEDIPHIFKRFYRADRARTGDGYGLGLALAQCIARAHGCSIEVESQEQRGSQFKVVFPALQGKAEVTRQVKSAFS